LFGGKLTTHADSTEEEKVAASEALNHVQTGESRDDVHTVGYDLDDEGALEAGVLEVLCSVVDCGVLGEVCVEVKVVDLQMKLTPVSC
jgi:hypothetical protein